MASASLPSTRSVFLESLNAFTPQINTPAREWALPLQSASCNVTMAASGSTLGPAKEPRSSSPSQSDFPRELRQPYVLLVEDNKLDIMVVREAFVRYQITADLHVVEDGDAAIRFIETTENTESAPCPELVLLDLNLP